MKFPLALTVVAALSVVATTATAAPKKSRALQFDVLEPHGVLTRPEWEVAVKHAVSPAYRVLDVSHDGRFARSGLTDAERDALRKAADLDFNSPDKVPDRTAYTRAFERADAPVTIAAADKLLDKTDIEEKDVPDAAGTPPRATDPDHLPPLTRVTNWLAPRIRLRSDESQLDERDLKAAKPATFSYASDLENSADIWQAHGILALQLSPPPPDPKTAGKLPASGRHFDELTRIYIGIESDRTTNSGNRDKETNTLAGKLVFTGGLFKFPNSDRTGDFAYWRATPFYATDWDLDSSVAGINLAAGPFVQKWGMGTFQPIPFTHDTFRYHWQPEVLVQYKHVFADGGNASLADATDYLRLGGQVSVTVRPWNQDWRDRFAITLSYQHTNDANNDWNGNDAFDGKLTYDLDKDGHMQVSLSYVVGTTPLLEQDKKLLSIGFNVKF